MLSSQIEVKWICVALSSALLCYRIPSDLILSYAMLIIYKRSERPRTEKRREENTYSPIVFGRSQRRKGGGKRER